MKVLLDARKLGDGGIGVYLENLVDGLLQLRREYSIDISLSLLVSVKNVRQGFVGSRRVTDCVARWKQEVEYYPESSGKYSPAEYFLLATRQRSVLKQQDIFHSPHYTLPFFLKLPSVVTVHDLIHLTHPDTILHRPLSRALISSALSRANHVVTVSEHSRNQLLSQFKYSVPITVIPNALRVGIGPRGTEEVRRLLSKLSLGSKYLLFVGSERPHKGFTRLLKAYSLLGQSQDKQIQLPQLVFVGAGFTDYARSLVQANGLASVVKFLGEVSVDDLSVLYSGASALVLCSDEEGFGFPALEALACGCKLVSTPLASVYEICGNAAIYSSDFSVEALVQALRVVVLEDKVDRSEVVQTGFTLAANFNRLQGARKTYQVYQRILGRTVTEFDEKSRLAEGNAV